MTEPGFTEPEREVLLTAAALAPSMHNTQPWHFRIGTTSVEVWLDRARALPAEDPHGRALHVSAGAALHNLRVAAHHLGYAASVIAAPDADQPDLAGRISIDATQSADATLAAQFPAVATRRTNRSPFADRSVPSADVDALVATAELEGAHLHVVTDSDDVDRLVSLAYDAERDDEVEATRLAERQAWVGGEREHEGIPSAALGPRSHDRRAPVRDLSARKEDRLRPKARFESHPMLLVLSTRRDHPADWVRAGSALQRVLLEATVRGLSTSFLNQALEHADLRWLVRDPLHGTGHPQMMLRLGYGGEVPATPRRPLHDFADETPPNA
jgi:nitroreductase